MFKRILCPWHKESTPSMVVYPDGHGFCYGCGKHAVKGEIKGVEFVEDAIPRLAENVAQTLEYIQALPLQIIRGLKLHVDAQAYYIVWPSGDYYKKRLLESDSNSDKYRCPVGVSKPLFIIPAAKHTRQALVVEGEINALSAAEVYKDADIISPGGAGDFYGSTVKKHMSLFRRYQGLAVVTDDDKAGAIAAIKFKALVLPQVPRISINLVKKDFNDVLTKEGQEALKAQIKTYLEV